MPKCKNKARGNPGKRKRKSAAKQQTRVGQCPEWLDKAAQAKWKELAGSKEMQSVGADALAAYCQAWAEFEIATRTLHKKGRQVESANGVLKPHPAVAQQRSAWKAIIDFRRLLGDQSPADPEVDEFEQFLGG
jgi:P27 family predicted phage terminase small subunit